MYEDEQVGTHKKIRIMLDEPRFPPGVVSEKPIFPLYRHSPRPVRLSDEEILLIARSYGKAQTLDFPTYTLEDGTYPETHWNFEQEDLLGFARELIGKNQ